jgi:hypothetical protein
MRSSPRFGTEERQLKPNLSAIRKRILTIPPVFSGGGHSSVEADSETGPAI